MKTALLLSVFLVALQAQTTPAPELWYFQHSYITSPTAVQYCENLIDQAAAAGYTGVVMWDTGINVLQLPGWNASYMQQVIQYAQSKGLKVMPQVAPYGHSTDILRSNPNLAEGEQVVGTRLQVDPNGQTMHVVNSSPGLVNGGFESGKTAWFSYGDAGAVTDTSTAHSGSTSALISGALNPSANARLFQSFAVQPWRQYHMRMFVKTQNFQGYSQIEIFGDNTFAYNRVNQPLNLPANQNWTQWDYTFNSGPHTTMSILMGVWGGNQGNVWFDDVTVAETALVYVLRSSSTPLKIYDPANPSHVFNEGTDFGAIADPKYATNPTFDDNWHAPMTVTVPVGSTLKPGQTVAMDWYAIQPVYADAGVSLTDPAAWQWMTDNATAVGRVFPNAGGYFLGYDEMRHMNSTASAKAKNMTAGQLLAWHFKQTYDLFRSVNPQTPIYVWSDMFDPNHNAINNYYLVEGDISGSWLGLPSDVIVMNWNLAGLNKSATWFSGTNTQQPVPYRQIIAGYYDSGNGANSANTELAQIAGVPGVIGFMYTTFNDDYSQLASFASAVKAGWNPNAPPPPPPPPPVPATPGTAAFVKLDTTTQGNWKGVYGADGSAIVNDATKYPAYATVSVNGANAYTWVASTTDPRALLKTAASGGIASTWFSGSGFTIDVNLTDGASHQMGVYALDWDGLNRAERVDVVDASSGAVLDSRSLTAFKGGQYLVWNLTGHVQLQVTLTGGENAVVSGLFFGPGGTAAPGFTLAASPTIQTVTPGTAAQYLLSVAGFGGFNSAVTLTSKGLPAGAVLSFSPSSITGSGSTLVNVQTATSTPVGSYPLTLTATSGSITHTIGLTMTVAVPAKGPAATFVKTDTTTKGNWKTVYGKDGVGIANNVTQYPSYAQVSFASQNLYTWAANTSDTRALQTSTGRIASTWFSSSYTIDVNVMDGNTHPVSLYALDWDNLGRAERVDVLNAATGAVIDSRSIAGFSGGQYWTWNVSGHVKFRVTLTSGANAVLSGLFFN